MSNQQQYITLDSCINDYLSESEQSNHKYYKLWNLAVRGMDELGLDFFYAIKSEKLPVNANKTVTIPGDYLQWSKIGVLNGVGEIIPLSYNSKLTTYKDLSPNRQAKTEDNSLYNFFYQNAPIFYNWWNGDTYINLYGLPSGAPFVGDFKIDEINNVILLNEAFSYEYLMVEYLAAPDQNGTYRIPIQFREAIIAYLSWRDIRSIPTTRRGSATDKELRKTDFYNQRRLAYARYQPFSLIEAYEWSLKNQRLTVKM